MPKSLEHYNKQLEALRQQDDAEKMIKAGDYANARDKLLETLDFFPNDDIIPMLTLCSVLLASSPQIPGIETDYYRIIGLTPSSSPQDIARKYNELQKLLQPAKDSFPEATQLAMKFIHEAVLVLVDSAKRGTFDSLRKAALDRYESLAADSPKCSQKGTEVYPIKGEIWAMHRNSEHQIVEILTEFSKGGDDKMMVAKLKEVEGYISFYQRIQIDGFSLTSEVSETEMIGFSHRIRFWKVGVPKDCYQLEPDDLPQFRSENILQGA